MKTCDQLVDPSVLDGYGHDDESVDFQRELVALFDTDSVRRLEEMGCALRLDDAQSIGRSAHAVRGGSAMIGAVAVAEICAEIERECAVASTTAVASLVDRLEAALTQTTERLHRLVGS
jgi:HPt (histidine-containing phosphotransfer) domain-containing protein